MSATRVSQFEQASLALGRAACRLNDAKAEVARAEKRYRAAEEAAALAAMVEVTSPESPAYRTARAWLVWWYNNGHSSPRLDGPCVTTPSAVLTRAREWRLRRTRPG